MKSGFQRIWLVSVCGWVACGGQAGFAVAPPPIIPVFETALCETMTTGDNIRLSDSIGESTFPDILYADGMFHVAWTDRMGRLPLVATVALRPDDRVVSPPQTLPQIGTCRRPSLGGDGHAVYLAWLDESNLQHVRLSDVAGSLQTLGKDVEFAVAGPYGSLVWVSEGTLQFRSEGMLRTDRRGRLIPPYPVVLARGHIEAPSVAWSGELFAVVWSEAGPSGRNIRMQRVARDGELFGDKVAVSMMAGVAARPVVAWNGEEFAVAWTHASSVAMANRDDFAVHMAVVPEKAPKPRRSKRLEFNGSADEVALVAFSQGYGLAFLGTREPAGSAIYFQLLDSEMETVGPTLRVSDDAPDACGRPRLAVGDEGFGIVWHDERDFSSSQIYVSTVFCRPDEPETGLIAEEDGIDASDPAPAED